MPAGVIFDMDGVLVDSGPAHHRSWQMLAREHRIEVSQERFNNTFGRPSRDIIRIIWGQQTSDEQINRLDEQKERLYREIVSGDLPLMPGCRELLANLSRAGFLLGVATSGPRENLELVLREGQIADYFCATVNGFDIARGKPAPDCFLLAAERMGLPANRCVVVEDAPVGVQAAVAAGMKAIALAGTHPPEPLSEAGASAVVRRLDEITSQVVGRLAGNPGETR